MKDVGCAFAMIVSVLFWVVILLLALGILHAVLPYLSQLGVI